MKDREKAHSEGRRQVGTGDRASHDVCNPDCCPLGPFLQALRPMHPSGGHQTNGMVGQTRDDLQVQNRPVDLLQVPHLKQSDDLPWTPPKGCGLAEIVSLMEFAKGFQIRQSLYTDAAWPIICP